MPANRKGTGAQPVKKNNARHVDPNVIRVQRENYERAAKTTGRKALKGQAMDPRPSKAKKRDAQ